MNKSVYAIEDWGFKSLRPRHLWRALLDGRQLVLKTRVVLGLGVRFLCSPPGREVGEAGLRVLLKTARWQFVREASPLENPVTSHSLPHSSMAEQAAVNRKVVGSSPTGAAIHCRVDDMESRARL